MVKSTCTIESRGTDLPLPTSLVEEDEDRISLLPEPLICHILSFLRTRQAVCTSVLSSTWRNLWKWVPTLKLESFDFPSDEACDDFIDKFLNFQSLREFDLCIFSSDLRKDAFLYEPCLSKLIKRKIQRFHVHCYREIDVPLTLPPCEALVCLSLCGVRLNDFESLYLPSLKKMFLAYVILPSDTSPSWVLDTPRLESLTFEDNQFQSFKIISMNDSVKVVDIDVEFKMEHHDLSERNIIYNLLNNFSAVRDITLSRSTLEIIYCLVHMSPLPKFRYLTCLRAAMFLNSSLKLLPIVLESCPKLKRLKLGLFKDDNTEGVANGLSNVLSYCLVSSLEYVEIVSLMITDKETVRKLVRYFLGNATSLKKLVLRFIASIVKKPQPEDPALLKQFFDSERRSHSCQFEVLFY